MSQLIRNLVLQDKRETLTREEMLALPPALEYKDKRTKQSHYDETDIVKIMSRFSKTGTISYLAKYEGTYSDYSDYNFHEHMTKLAKGDQIFAELPAEIRKEFHQDPEEFFAYVNDPKNAKDLRVKLPGLAAPGRQLDELTTASADLDAAKAIVKAAEDAVKPPPQPTKEVADIPPPPPPA